MLPKDLTKDIKTRLQSVKGQMDGLIKMIDDEHDPEKILNQFKAAQNGLDKAHHLLLDEAFRKALALKIVASREACPGDCGNEDQIEQLRTQFPTLELDELTEKMKEIAEIKQRMEAFLDQKNSK